MQINGYWIEDGVWGADGLTRGTYTGLAGTQYESAYGRSLTLGSNGEISWRMAWKWPTGTTEVKSYPSAVAGNKPGWLNSWTTPGGHAVLLENDTYRSVYPSGPTPNSFFALAANGNLAPVRASFDYEHLVTPSGRGHLAFDIWLQDRAEQTHGFSTPPITHEVMIPLTWWGG